MLAATQRRAYNLEAGLGVAQIGGRGLQQQLGLGACHQLHGRETGLEAGQLGDATAGGFERGDGAHIQAGGVGGDAAGVGHAHAAHGKAVAGGVGGLALGENGKQRAPNIPQAGQHKTNLTCVRRHLALRCIIADPASEMGRRRWGVG